jgi:hypothetical protein
MGDIVRLIKKTKTEPDPLLIKELEELLANIKDGRVESAAVLNVIPSHDGFGMSICWGGVSMDLIGPVQVLLRDLTDDATQYVVE